jgi:hypothetical protein
MSEMGPFRPNCAFQACPVYPDSGGIANIATLRICVCSGAALVLDDDAEQDLLAALIADALAGTALTFVGLPDLSPLPWWQTLAVFGYAMVSCLIVNDAAKVAMIKWRVPLAVA